MSSPTLFPHPRARPAWRSARPFICAFVITLAASMSAQAAPPRLALNAPSCAQEIENYRRECLRKCENDMVKAQCARACNDPDKLSPRLAQCEGREKKKPEG